MSNDMLTQNLSVPVGAATTAKLDFNTDAGNLIIDKLAGGEPLLASGTLQYFEKQGPPVLSASLDNGRARLSVRSGDIMRAVFHFPWSTSKGAFEWQIHLNPAVSSDITARSGGGNLRLDLAGMAVSRLCADTGAGNVDVRLPDNTANLSVTARAGAGNVSIDIGSGITGGSTVEAHSGAGNVDVRLPRGIPARIHATSGIGRVTVDSRFSVLDRHTYQSPGYDSAADKVEITVHSGAGNVTVN